MHLLNNASRRLFLRQAGAMSAVMGAGAPLALNLAAMGSAAAQGVGDYKAMVCVFLYGGNDAFNMVLPTDSASWAAYVATRNQAPDPIALLAAGTPANSAAAAGSPARLGGVLPLAVSNPQGRSYALHPMLTGLQGLFNSGRRVAVLPNIGPLIAPLTKAQYANTAFPRPVRLYSHNDQQNTWQALAPEGSTRGWGGRLADPLAMLNGRPIFSAISVAGNSVWLSGDQVVQYQVGSTGALPLGVDGSGRIFGSAVAGATLQRLASTTRGSHPLETDSAAVAARAIAAEAALRNALRAPSDAAFGTAPASGSYAQGNDPKLRYTSPLTGAAAYNGLAGQLQMVARLVEAGISGATGARRQVFFVSLGGFDTHDLQNRSQADLMARLDHALSYFDTALGALNARSQVTAFTASDFGRTFTSNGDGTDHGWGSHHFVMGGAVKGGDLYGSFPTLSVKNANNNNFDGSPNQLANGALLPGTAVDQLGYTLGSWFGLSAGQLMDVFPNLANFNASVRNLGFMNA
jgi:uncharacterized protein (DUF1501 family)